MAKAVKREVKKTVDKKVKQAAKKEDTPVVEETVAKEIGDDFFEKKVQEIPASVVAEIEIKHFDEFTIKEIMIQKNVSREKAIEILRNPSK